MDRPRRRLGNAGARMATIGQLPKQGIYGLCIFVIGIMLINQMIVFIGASIVGVTARYRRAFNDSMSTMAITVVVVFLAPGLAPMAILVPLLLKLQRFVEWQATK